MNRVHVLVLAGIILMLPLVASASWFPGDPLVPREVLQLVTGSNASPQQVNACHLVDLVDNLLDFGVYLAALVATIMFVYAGILYVTASARQENLNQAKNIFGKVLLGFAIILSAWLIINIILTITTGKDINTFTNFNCSPPAFVPQPSSSGVDSVISGDPDAIGLETQKRDQLEACGVDVNHPNACPAGVTSGCTTIAGLDQNTISSICAIRTECDTLLSEPCFVQVTGGTEGGHSGGSRPGSHGGGDKVDLDLSLKGYVDEQVKAGRFKSVNPHTFGRAQWFDTQTGAVWTEEFTHYDVCLSNCSAPAARGT